MPLKRWNGTSWDIVAGDGAAGLPGAAGIVTSASAPSDITVLWADTTVTTNNALIPAGGTTGQYLAKTSATDYSTAWMDNANYAAGKNKIINGDFGVWQRGTSFSNPANETYLADRFNIVFDGTGSTRTISQQAQTPNAISGYDYPYFFRFAQTVAGSGGTYVGMNQRIEGVQTFAANTITLSFWAKADATRTITPNLQQNFGSGGSTTVSTGNTAITITTSWARYTQTFNLPSISGKTIGTSSFLQLFLGLAANTVQTVDLFGVQLEAGSTATAFQTATGTIQGELAACQRYYNRIGTTGGAYYSFFGGYATSGTNAEFFYNPPVTMRVKPTSIDYPALSNFWMSNFNANWVPTSLTFYNSSSSGTLQFEIQISGGGMTTYGPLTLRDTGGGNAYLGISAEL
jgi:hypothetical protein